MNIQSLKKAAKLVGGQARLGKSCGVTQTAVHKWLSGKSVPRPKHAIAIEKATGGAVTRFDLIPEFYEGIDRDG